MKINVAHIRIRTYCIIRYKIHSPNEARMVDSVIQMIIAVKNVVTNCIRMENIFSYTENLYVMQVLADLGMKYFIQM